jgi:protease I
MTSWPSLQTDIRNVGGEWLDQELVVDPYLLTIRKPDDLPAFNREMLRLFASHQEGKHEPRVTSRPGAGRTPRG